MTVKVVLRAVFSMLLLTALLLATPRVEGQLYQEAPGRREFTGDMLVRPIQVQHWMDRGFTREQPQELHRQTTAWLVEFLDDRILDHHERMDRYRFRVRPGESENEVAAFLRDHERIQGGRGNAERHHDLLLRHGDGQHVRARMHRP